MKAPMIPHHLYTNQRATDDSFKHYFGLRPQDKWPNDGKPTIIVNGVMLWVNPLDEHSRQGVPRLMARCPACTRDLAGGRYDQHRRACKITIPDSKE